MKRTLHVSRGGMDFIPSWQEIYSSLSSCTSWFYLYMNSRFGAQNQNRKQIFLGNNSSFGHGQVKTRKENINAWISDTRTMCLVQLS